MESRHADISQLAEANKRLEHLNRVMKAIRNVNQLITHVKDRDRLLQGACDCLTETRGYFNAWIALFGQEGEFDAHYESGLDEAFAPMAQLLRDGKQPHCCGQALPTGGVIVIHNPATSCTDCPLSGGYAGRSGMATPIAHEGRIFGMLSASIPSDFATDTEEQALLEEVADDIALALYSLDMESQRDSLEQSLLQAKHIIESTPSIIFRWKAAEGWPVEYVSRNVSVLGYRPEDFLSGRVPYASIIHPDDRDRVTREVAQHATDGVDEFQQEYRVLDPQGTVHWVADETSVERDERNVAVAFQGVVIDITQRRQSEETLRESEARYRTLIEQTGDCLLVHDFDARILDVNDFSCSAYGYSREELLGMKVSDLDPDYKQREAGGSFWEDKKLYEPVVFEARQQRKNGEIFPVEVRLSLIKYRGETVVLGICRDITERKRIERDLIDSEHRFRSFVENANDIVYALTPEGVFTYMSPNWLDHLGEPAAEAIGRSFEPYVHPDDVHLCRAFLQGVLAEGRRSSSVEYRIFHKDGSIRWHVSTGSVVRDETGQVVNYVGIARDVTEKKLAQQEIQNLSTELREILDALPDAIVYADIDRRIKAVNPAFTRIFGYAPEEVLGKPTRIIYCNDEEFSEQGRQRYNTDARDVWEPYEICYLRKDGTRFTSETVGTPVRDAEGHVVGLLGVVRDITERKEAEQALSESESRYRELARHYPDGALFLFDRDLRYLAADGQELERVGLKAEGIVGRTVREVFPALADIVVPHQLAVFKGEKRTYEVTYQDNIYTNTAIPIRDAEGQVTRGLVITQNITARKQMEDRVRQLEKMEAVGRLAGGVAHDFNNMLTVILGNVQLTHTVEDIPPMIWTALSEIERAAQRSADLTRQLLAFARKQTIAPRMLDLNETIESMLKMFRRLIGEDIDLSWMPASDLWPVLIDPGQVDQLLANLCVNARDAITGVGRVTIETGNEAFDEEYCSHHADFTPGEYVRLTISDDGCGMDDATRHRIFEPFFTTKGEGQGTGLGLATVYGIVKQNEGFVSVYSEPGQGTTFHIYLPRHIPEPGKEKAAAEPPESPVGNETILFVEDEAAILRLGKAMLESLGYRVLTAKSPAEAIRTARRHADGIHLLVTDVVMPEMNGRDLAKRLQAEHPNLRSLFMSGYTENAIAHHGVLDKDVHFLQKPFSRGDLARKVREALKAR